MRLENSRRRDTRPFYLQCGNRVCSAIGNNQCLSPGASLLILSNIAVETRFNNNVWLEKCSADPCVVTNEWISVIDNVWTMENEVKQRNQRNRRRERAQRMQAQRESKAKDGDSAEDESPAREKPPRPAVRRKKSKEPMGEEDIIDGFAIMSFRTYEDLEVSQCPLSSGVSPCRPPTGGAPQVCQWPHYHMSICQTHSYSLFLVYVNISHIFTFTQAISPNQLNLLDISKHFKNLYFVNLCQIS